MLEEVHNLKLGLLIGWLIFFIFFAVGFMNANLSYDFLNYLSYVTNFDRLASRFATEPAFVYTVKLLLLFFGNSFILATKALYGLALALLANSAFSLLLSIRRQLFIRSIVPPLLIFVLVVPLIFLISIVPRQSFSLAISFFAVSFFIRKKSNPGESTIKLDSVTYFSLLSFLSFLFHNLSGIIFVLFFVVLFLPLRSVILLFSLAVALLLVLYVYLFDSPVQLINFFGVNHAINKFGDLRETGFMRLITFLVVCFSFLVFHNRSLINQFAFSFHVKVKVLFFILAAPYIYYYIATDVARSFYFPIILLWGYVGMSLFRRSTYKSLLGV